TVVKHGKDIIAADEPGRPVPAELLVVQVLLLPGGYALAGAELGPYGRFQSTADVAAQRVYVILRRRGGGHVPPGRVRPDIRFPDHVVHPGPELLDGFRRRLIRASV